MTERRGGARRGAADTAGTVRAPRRRRGRSILGLTLGLALMLPGAAAWAGAIEQMKAFSGSTRAASGEFTQRTLKSTGEVAESSRGRFSFARPGRFRWEVLAPYEQLMVADGKQVFFFDKDLDQVTVRKLDDGLGATPAAILFGTGDLSASFKLSEAGQRDGLDWLDAQPLSKDAGFERISIGLSGDEPRAMEVRDSFNRLTVFRFDQLLRNPVIDPQQFRFTPPAGAEVVQQ